MATGDFFLGSNAYSVDEGGRVAKVTIVRADGAKGTVRVDFTTYNDSADSGADYRGKSGTVTFKSGQTEKTVKIPIKQDNEAEGVERFFFDLLGVRDAASDAKLLAPRTAVVTILDDDAPNTATGSGVAGAIDPRSFSEEIVVSGLTQPTAVQWLPGGGTMLIAEKSGLIRVFEYGGLRAEPLVDMRAKVNDVQDRGLLDIEVHPDFPNNPYVYVTYVYDPPETEGYTAAGGADGPGNRPAIVSRLTIDPETLTASDEVILVGKDGAWENISGPTVDSTNDLTHPTSPLNGVDDYIVVDSRSHATGDLEFGPDGKGNPLGALYVSVGDGASFNAVDARGAVRVQDKDNLSGKILRIDPITGSGLGGNPEFQRDDPDGNLSKVYAMGFRNTFRFSVDSSSGEIYGGDVGWNSWEEINRIALVGRGQEIPNFGWPFYEGTDKGSLGQADYQALGLPFPGESQVISPYLSFAHGDPDKPFNAIVIGEIYRGNVYPTDFNNDLFFGDFNQGDIYALDVSDPTKTLRKLTNHSYIADMLLGPDGFMYFVDLVRGQIGRWDIVDPNGATLVGGAGANRLSGKEGSDVLRGLAGNDRLEGNGGDDTLDGGPGRDVMIGGLRNDTFIVDTRADRVVEHRDEGTDTVQVEAALSSNARKNVYALPKHVENVTLAAGAGGAGARGNADANTLTGNAEANELRGSQGDDTLRGGAGDDVLDGGAGADFLFGGPGDDEYWVDDTADRVIENAGEGTETVRSSVDQVLSIYVEHLVLTGRAAIDGTGNAGANALTGNARDNRLNGGSGDDTLSGGGGADTFVVERGSGSDVDTVIDFAKGSDLIDLGSYGLAVGDWQTLGPMIGDDGGDARIELPGGDVLILSGVDWRQLRADDFAGVVSGEYWRGSDRADNYSGTDGDDRLVGLDGSDTLAAGDGDDDIVAGGGDDRVIAGDGAGDDTYHGGDGVDTLVFTSATKPVRVNLAKGTAAGATIGRDRLDGFENVIGGRGNDTIHGDAGKNLLDGHWGKDRLAGGPGDDHYLVDHGAEAVVEKPDEGWDWVFVRSPLGPAASKNVFSLAANIENLRLLPGAGDASAKGNAARNFLHGNAGANTLNGDRGDDDVSGYQGADRLLGGDGNDRLDGGPGDDVLDGGGGNDTLIGGDGVDSYDGGAGDDVLQLDAADLSGGAFEGGAGVDRAEIDARGVTFDLADYGIEWAVGGGGADTLIGGAADETLDGGPGRDDLAGGAGDDLYRVNASRDTVRETADGGTDRIESTATYTLPANVEHLTLTGDGNARATGNALNNSLLGNDGKNVLIGGDGNDTLDSGALGNDTLRGDSGDDRLIGRDGRDALIGGDGNDTLIGGNDADTLTGGDGGDRFVFADPADSTAGRPRDVIRDFDPTSDLLDFSSIGDFRYVENAEFDGPFQVRFSRGMLQVNVAVDADGADDPEMEIVLSRISLDDLGADPDPSWWVVA